ncbi:MAG TPA: hypothetical protein VIK80_01275 [Flavihumibacter sp.]|jgi:hypothetical protein
MTSPDGINWTIRSTPADNNWYSVTYGNGLLTPTSPVQSVAGKTGAVTLVKGDVGLDNVENYGIASQADAEAGTANNKYMTPARVKQAIDAFAAPKEHQHVASDITQDSTHRFVTDAEKAAWNAKADKTVATTSNNGLMSSADKAKLDGIEAGANKYVHPTGDGNLHVPPTGTSNNNKVLKAGATAGSLSWGYVNWNEVDGKPVNLASIVVSGTEPTNADFWYQEI